MIVTLPVTFFLKQQLQSGENQIVWTRVGREFQLFEFPFEEGPCRQKEKNFSMAKWLNY